MQMKIVTEDDIILGFGKNFFDYAYSIVDGVKEMRAEINEIIKRDFSRVHIIDHDLDSEGNIVPLLPSEILIRIKGEVKLNRLYDSIKADTIVSSIISQLRKVILENIVQIRNEY